MLELARSKEKNKGTREEPNLREVDIHKEAMGLIFRSSQKHFIVKEWSEITIDGIGCFHFRIENSKTDLWDPECSHLELQGSSDSKICARCPLDKRRCLQRGAQSYQEHTLQCCERGGGCILERTTETNQGDNP